MSVRLGEILIKESLITQDQLDKALEFQRSNGGKLGSCLTKMGFHHRRRHHWRVVAAVRRTLHQP